MATYGSSDVTVKVQHRRYIAGGRGQYMTAGYIEFGDGSLTYATGGVPLPAATAFGFGQTITWMDVNGPEYVATTWPGGTTAVPTVAPTAGFYKANYLNAINKLQLNYVPALGTTAALALTELAASAAPTLSAYRFIAFGH